MADLAQIMLNCIRTKDPIEAFASKLPGINQIIWNENVMLRFWGIVTEYEIDPAQRDAIIQLSATLIHDEILFREIPEEDRDAWRELFDTEDKIVQNSIFSNKLSHLTKKTFEELRIKIESKIRELSREVDKLGKKNKAAADCIRNITNNKDAAIFRSFLNTRDLI